MPHHKVVFLAEILAEKTKKFFENMIDLPEDCASNMTDMQGPQWNQVALHTLQGGQRRACFKEVPPPIQSVLFYGKMIDTHWYMSPS